MPQIKVTTGSGCVWCDIQIKHRTPCTRIAPNTSSGEIRRHGRYHNVGKGTVDSGEHTPSPCKRCKGKQVANPAHVVAEGKGRDTLGVYCSVHCPVCVLHRKLIP